MKKFYTILVKRPNGEWAAVVPAGPVPYAHDDAHKLAIEYAAKDVGFEYIVMEASSSFKTSQPEVIETVFE